MVSSLVSHARLPCRLRHEIDGLTSSRTPTLSAVEGVGFWEIRRVTRGVVTILRVLPRVSARWFVVFVLTTSALVVCTVGTAFGMLP